MFFSQVCRPLNCHYVSFPFSLTYWCYLCERVFVHCDFVYDLFVLKFMFDSLFVANLVRCISLNTLPNSSLNPHLFLGVCVFFCCSYFHAFFMLQILAYFQILINLYTCLILSGYHILLWYACVPSIFEGFLLTFCVLNIAVRLKWRFVISIKVLLFGF